MKAVERLIGIASGEVGYLEKRSGKDLDDKTGNAGSANYTKYARDLYPSLQGQPWCDMFVDWCFVQAFGLIAAAHWRRLFRLYADISPVLQK